MTILITQSISESNQVFRAGKKYLVPDDVGQMYVNFGWAKNMAIQEDPPTEEPPLTVARLKEMLESYPQHATVYLTGCGCCEDDLRECDVIVEDTEKGPILNFEWGIVNRREKK